MCPDYNAYDSKTLYTMLRENFKNFLENLKEQMSAVDIISKHVKLERKGHNWVGRCPFHSEKTGSFTVDPDKGLYYCFGCGAHGDVIKFVMEIEKMSFMEAVKYLANMHGMEVPEERSEEAAKYKAEDEARARLYEIMEAAKIFFQRQLRAEETAESQKAMEYLKNRNISKESMDKFQLGFACNEEILVFQLKKKGFSEDLIIKTGLFFKSRYNKNNKSGLGSKFFNRITFPIIDSRGRCVGFGGRVVPGIGSEKDASSSSKEKSVAKYLNSPETEIFVKNHQLYGYNLARRGQSRDISRANEENINARDTIKDIILVEGYMDVIAMHQAGFETAVAPLGTSISETQINMCWKVCDNPIICLDGDSAGKKASFRWLDKIMPMLIPGKSFRFARLPQDSDPDVLLLNGRSDLVDSALRNAQSLSDWMWEGAFLLHPSDTPEEKAAIVKMLKDKTREIKDGSISRLYAQYMKQKENELYRYKWKSFGFSPQKSRELVQQAGESVTPAISVKEKTEKILVVTIINHPYIIDKVIENFAEIEFGSSWARKMKTEIMRIYDEFYVPGEPQKGEEAISELGKNLASIERDIEIHAKFVGKFEKNGVSEEEVISGWYAFFEKYKSAPAMAEDLHAASVSLQSSFSESDWQRLKALKNGMLQAKSKI